MKALLSFAGEVYKEMSHDQATKSAIKSEFLKKLKSGGRPFTRQPA